MCDQTALIKRLKMRESAAFDELVGEFEGFVYDFHCWLTGDLALAEDLTQETFLSVWRGLGGFRGEATLFTWIRRVAYNTALQHFRKEKIKAMPLDKFEAQTAHESAEAAAQREILRDEVREALAQLSQEKRDAVVLNKMAGLSHAEVARLMKKPLGTVKWLIAQALAELGLLLEERGVTGNEV